MEKRNRDATSRIEIDLVVRWLWYFIKYYETEEEINLSMELLNFYLKEKTSQYILVRQVKLQERKIREYITKSYQPPCIGCFRLCLIA
jgi:N-glycosylase/DNA lyase